MYTLKGIGVIAVSEEHFLPLERPKRALTLQIVTGQDIGDSWDKIIHREAQLIFGWEVRVGARAEIGCARSVRSNGFGSGLSEASECSAIRALELEASEQRDQSVTEHGVVGYVGDVRPSDFFGFFAS